MGQLRSSSGLIHLPLIIAGFVLTVTTLVGGVVISRLSDSQDNRSQAAFSCTALTSQASCQSTQGCSWTPPVTTTESHGCIYSDCNPMKDGCRWTTQINPNSGICKVKDNPDIECYMYRDKPGCETNQCKWEYATYQACVGTYTTSETEPGFCSGTIINPTPTPTPSPTPTPCASPNSCSYSACVGATVTTQSCPAPAYCCAPVYTGNHCPYGNSYCDTDGQLRVCKLDKSGYEFKACAGNYICPVGQSACQPKPTPYCSDSKSQECDDLGRNCVIDLNGGHCGSAIPIPTPTPRPNPIPPTSCQQECQGETGALYNNCVSTCEHTATLRPDNSACSTNADCQSNNCQTGPAGKYCLRYGQTFSVKVSYGGSCGTTPYNQECADNNVCTYNVCMKKGEGTTGSQAQMLTYCPINPNLPLCRTYQQQGEYYAQLYLQNMPQTSQEWGMAALQGVNTLTFGAFGDYVASNVGQNTTYGYDTSDYNYWQRVVNYENIRAATQLGATLVGEAAVGIYAGAALGSTMSVGTALAGGAATTNFLFSSANTAAVCTTPQDYLNKAECQMATAQNLTAAGGLVTNSLLFSAKAGASGLKVASLLINGVDTALGAANTYNYCTQYGLDGTCLLFGITTSLGTYGYIHDTINLASSPKSYSPQQLEETRAWINSRPNQLTEGILLSNTEALSPVGEPKGWNTAILTSDPRLNATVMEIRNAIGDPAAIADGLFPDDIANTIFNRNQPIYGQPGSYAWAGNADAIQAAGRSDPVYGKALAGDYFGQQGACVGNVCYQNAILQNAVVATYGSEAPIVGVYGKDFAHAVNMSINPSIKISPITTAQELLANPAGVGIVDPTWDVSFPSWNDYQNFLKTTRGITIQKVDIERLFIPKINE